MRIRILCVGRMKDGPERALVDDYVVRAQKSGKSLGYRAVEEIEIPPSSKDDEGTRLLAKHGQGILIRLDERGEAWTSQDLSKRHTISFGVQTWPHRLVRVMIAEQVYRALSIEAGSPYHRE